VTKNKVEVVYETTTHLRPSDRLYGYGSVIDVNSRTLQSRKANKVFHELVKRYAQLGGVYNKESTKNVGDLINLYTASAFGYLVRPYQGVDRKVTKLTTAAKQANEDRGNYTYKEGDGKYFGLPGTLSWWCPTENFAGILDIDLIESCLIEFWEFYGYSLYTKPWERLDKVLGQVGINGVSWGELGNRLVSIAEHKTGTSKQWNFLKVNMLDASMFKELKVRYATQEVPTKLHKFIIDAGAEMIDVESVKKQSIKFGYLGGLPTMYLAFVVESFLITSEYLKSLNETILNEDLDLFLTLSLYVSQRKELARRLSLVYDASSILAVFNTYSDMNRIKRSMARMLKNLLVGQSVILRTDDYRLLNFEDTV